MKVWDDLEQERRARPDESRGPGRRKEGQWRQGIQIWSLSSELAGLRIALRGLRQEEEDDEGREA
jgi:hypothetical protein